MKKLGFIIVIVYCLFTTGCAEMQQAMAEQTQQSIRNHCNADAAYAVGVNDAMRDHQMRINYANNLCPEPQWTELNVAYRKGYQYGTTQSTERGKHNGTDISIVVNGEASHYRGRHRPRPKQECLQTSSGRICGYHCVKNSYGAGICASNPQQHCAINSFGQSDCGYSCQQTMQNVKCAKHPGENCVKNNFGDIKCGKNCRIDQFDELHCD